MRPAGASSDRAGLDQVRTGWGFRAESQLSPVEEFDQDVAVAWLWRAPTTQSFAPEFFERAQQLGLGDHPFPVGVNRALAFGVAFISHHEWVSPFAVTYTELRYSASDVDVVFVDLVVHDGCSAHRPSVPVDSLCVSTRSSNAIFPLAHR